MRRKRKRRKKKQKMDVKKIIAIVLLLSFSMTVLKLSERELIPTKSSFIEMKLSNVEIKDDYAIVTLKNHCRELTFFVSKSQGIAIEDARNKIKHGRPSTHDLLESVLASLGSRVKALKIVNLKKGVYYGILEIVDEFGLKHEIDCRPSDGIVIALKTNAKILVARNLTRVTCSELM